MVVVGDHVWTYISAAIVGNLFFIEGNMDWYMYLDILKQNVLASAEKLSFGTQYFSTGQ